MRVILHKLCQGFVSRDTASQISESRKQSLLRSMIEVIGGRRWGLLIWLNAVPFGHAFSGRKSDGWTVSR